ncbi:hypothetical protein, partial [Pseudomonas syringae]|uniref:hypothetical protein n=1 Tax=Pseudomonas syringae TaxID=317 RepID=UPI001F38CAAE
MTLIYTRQAQSFLVPDLGLYKRGPAHQLIPYMVRMSGAIRSTSMKNRTAAVKMVQVSMHEAWAKIHRSMRPYFFQDIEPVLDVLEEVRAHGSVNLRPRFVHAYLNHLHSSGTVLHGRT